MSRNLAETHCYFCGSSPIKITGALHEITKDERGPYDEFDTMIVADAECPMCAAKYIAWCRPPIQGIHAENRQYIDPELGYFDLSFRSTFNDEPGESDYPEYEVRLLRVGPYDAKSN